MMRGQVTSPPVVVMRNSQGTRVSQNLQNRHSYHAGVHDSDFGPMGLHSYGGSAECVFGDPNAAYMYVKVLREEPCNNKRRSAVFPRLEVVREGTEMSEHQNFFDSSRGSLNIDPMQQGHDVQSDSPRGSTISGSSKGDSQHPHQHPHVMPQNNGFPIHGQVLVDPSTGQHYIVPQSAFFQPMQPMYYPPPQAAPMFYPYPPQQQGYPMSNGSMMGQYGAGRSPMLMNRHFPVPPRSVVSQPQDERREPESFDDPAPPSPSYPTHPTPPLRNFPTPPLSTASLPTPYRPIQMQSLGENMQPDDPESGFRRSSARSSLERAGPAAVQAQVNDRRPQKSERTPLYGGPPPWWAQEAVDPISSTSDVESSRRTSPPMKVTSNSDNEAARPPPRPAVPPARPVRMDFDFSAPSVEEKVQKPVLIASKSVRMDIDLATVVPQESPPEKSKAMPRAPATAFTVNFDDPEGDVSLQDAARKSVQARRILTRRTGNVNPDAPTKTTKPTRESAPNAPEFPENNTNKRYLLHKLLGKEDGEGPEGLDSAGGDVDRKDTDNVSEAGTFVIDTSTRQSCMPAHMMPSRIVEDSDATDDSSSDSDSEVAPSSAAAREVAPSTPKSDQRSGDFLKELAKLRQMAGLPPGTALGGVAAAPSRASESTNRTSTTRGRAVGVRPSGGATTSSARSVQPPPLPPQTAPSSANSGHRSRAMQPCPAAGTPNNRLSRGDGGRLSLRSSAGLPAAPIPGSPQLSGNKRPPFRAGGPTGRISLGNTQQQKEHEMNAWLRRKDYNPMKAAAEARKAKELKAREEQFASNRSMSFHVGPAPNFLPLRDRSGSRLSRNRSQESLAEDAATQASQRLIAEYSRGVVSDISRLTQQSNRPGANKLSGLARAVDMLSQKCKKSIELIRSQNKGCLSVSVEDLLSAAAEPPRVNESLNEQLERLSDAFDAVQRYLEQYSLDGHDSPVPQQFYEEDLHSAVSAFSNASLRSRSNSNEGPPSQSSYRSKILAHSNANKN
ncbi:unnamed protein product [Caenorhabditis auriculariae]|uniref:Uncharacterized protein n=1 Tax=Caenorhabditis auriculariae TaxID=2777116 RepID=A0A8S1GSS3_9PELO|nr:unnamed protein product [Caenorhabditis auriculariae]